METTEDNNIMKLVLECEECGVIKEMEGDSDVLHYAARAVTDEHWADAHYYPSIRYNWS